MFIRSLKLKNILSFRELPPFKLEKLNILIGPNGSGKSNLVDCLDLFQSLPNNLNGFLVNHGGPEAWIWKGKATSESVARLECELDLEEERLAYAIAFDTGAGVLVIQREWLAPPTRRFAGENDIMPAFVPVRHKAYLNRFAGRIEIRGRAASGDATISRTDSALAAYRDPLDK